MIFTFYATFGSGQAGYPGYLEITVEGATLTECEELARKLVREETDNHWAFMYKSLNEVHPNDRIRRGVYTLLRG